MVLKQRQKATRKWPIFSIALVTSSVEVANKIYENLLSFFLHHPLFPVDSAFPCSNIETTLASSTYLTSTIQTSLTPYRGKWRVAICQVRIWKMMQMDNGEINETCNESFTVKKCVLSRRLCNRDWEADSTSWPYRPRPPYMKLFKSEMTKLDFSRKKKTKNSTIGTQSPKDLLEPHKSSR